MRLTVKLLLISTLLNSAELPAQDFYSRGERIDDLRNRQPRYRVVCEPVPVCAPNDCLEDLVEIFDVFSWLSPQAPPPPPRREHRQSFPRRRSNSANPHRQVEKFRLEIDLDKLFQEVLEVPALILEAPVNMARHTICPNQSKYSNTNPSQPLPKWSTLPQPSTPQFDRRLLSGIEAYKDFRYEDCLAFLEDYLDDAAKKDPNYVEALVYAGAAAWMLGDERKASDSFREARGIYPGYEINAEEFGPGIVDLFSHPPW